MQWTKEQQEVIASRNAEVLVSAAAGSGKTAVLAQRVADMVIRDNLKMEELLVLTFTKASASDMREKIEEALTKAAREDSLSDTGRENCIEESEHITLAQISTIDSYCNRVVRENFPILEITPTYAVCEDEDRERLLDEAVRLALDDFYGRAEQNEGIRSFTETYSTKDVEQMMRALYQYVMARPEPEKWLGEKCSAKVLEQDFGNGPIANAYTRYYERMLVKSEEAQRELDCLIQKNELTGKEKYLALANQNADILTGLRGCVGKTPKDWMNAATAVRWPRRPVIRKKTAEEEELVKQIGELNSRVHECTADIKKNDWFSEERIADLKATGEMLDALRELTLLLMKYNREVKQRANMLDFADIEQLAQQLLSRKELREQEQKRAKAIFVDEYQDISPLQEDLLEKLKHEGGTIFYVGDVKQSIYRFRNAQPGNFLHKLKTFSDEKDAPQRRIILSKNFRSAKSVLDAANRVMEGVMREDLTELSYDENARLYQGREIENRYPTVLLELNVERVPGEKNEMKLYREVYLAAKQIEARKKNGVVYTNEGSRSARYSDFAVIMPKNKYAAPMQAMLRLMNIEASNDRERSVYEIREIRDLVEFLTLMDHPRDEEALFCVLRSWLFGFTAEEIAGLRLENQEGTLTEAVEAELRREEGSPFRKKLKTAMNFLERERYRVHNSNLFRYLWDFTRRTGLYEQVKNQKEGYTTTAALDQIIYEALRFEEEGFQGIDSFAQRLRRRCEAKHITPTPARTDDPDQVHIMSIHKSKGLQFPFVLVIGLGGDMSGRNDTAPIRIHDRLGVALRRFDPDLRVYRDTMLWEAIRTAGAAEERAECARLLYVAMTRASQQTILIGCAKGKSEPREAMNAYDVVGAGSYLDWLRPSIRRYDIVDGIQEAPADERDSSWEVSRLEGGDSVNPFAEPMKQEEEGRMPRELNAFEVEWGPEPLGFQPFEYERRISEALPKLSFSYLPRSVTPSTVNRAIQEGMVLPTQPEEIRSLKRIPQFEPKKAEELPLPEMREPNLDGPGTPEHSARARGTATHLLLQLCSFDRIRETLPTLPQLRVTLQTELERLCKNGQITAADRDNADTKMAARFFLHPIGQKALRAAKCYREKNFFCYYLPPLHNILLRGSMDLCFYDDEDEPGWVIVDYKTDFFTTPEELLQKYAGQLDCYRKGIRAATGQPIKICALFALRTGQAIRDNSIK